MTTGATIHMDTTRMDTNRMDTTLTGIFRTVTCRMVTILTGIGRIRTARTATPRYVNNIVLVGQLCSFLLLTFLARLFSTA